MIEKKLTNGINLIINPVQSAKSTTVLILVGAGSRYEEQKNRGISHFLEHMFFKGASKYKTPKSVSEAIDMIGGEFNAFTGKEYAGYYVKSANKFIETSFDVLSDMLIRPTFAQEEIEKERGVILEEMNMYLDMPKYQIAWEFEELIVGNQPLGWDQLGTKELINSVNSDDFHKYHKALYTPDNLIISISGDISEEKGTKLAEKYFSELSGKKAFEWKKNYKNISNERVRILNKSTEQTHLIVGFKGIPGNDGENIYKQKITSTLLGGMMSSRLFQNIREEKGLCYYIGTGIDDYTDFGIFSASMGVDNKRAILAASETLKEFENLKKNLPTEEELQKAKNYTIGKILLSTEDSESLAHIFGQDKLLYGKITKIEEVVKKVEKISLKDVENYINKFFKKENYFIAGIGPLKDVEGDLRDLLK